MDPHLPAELAPYVVPILVVVIVARRLIRNAPRKVKAGRLYILPGLLTLATIFALTQSGSPSAVWLLGYVVAAVLGASVGYLSARHREFTLDPKTGEISSQATPIGTIIFAALFVIRFGLKMAFPELSGPAYGSPVAHPSPAQHLIGWADSGLIFSTAMVVATAITTWLRTRPLIASQRSSSSPH